MALLELTPSGFYCEQGNFYIDPWQPVEKALVTHAHADHFRRGCKSYLVAEAGEHIFRTRLGDEAVIETQPYEAVTHIDGVKVSFHPAGHILGSAQIRLEYGGEVWVVSGDYKLDADPTCAQFEPVRCHTFITEATFGLPIYRWPSQEDVLGAINAWWRANAEAGKTSILYAYALGKAQRVMAGVDADIGPIYTHGAVERINEAYRASDVSLPPTTLATQAEKGSRERALVIAPISARGTAWVRRFPNHASAFVSGWMRIRGARRRRAVDRGFVLSDHADWPGLLRAIEATGAERIGVTHGYSDDLARWLREKSWQADALRTRYEGENEDADEVVEE
jgi:putative mRNA 3-end processing factor